MVIFRSRESSSKYKGRSAKILFAREYSRRDCRNSISSSVNLWLSTYPRYLQEIWRSSCFPRRYSSLNVGMVFIRFELVKYRTLVLLGFQLISPSKANLSHSSIVEEYFHKISAFYHYSKNHFGPSTFSVFCRYEICIQILRRFLTFHPYEIDLIAFYLIRHACCGFGAKQGTSGCKLAPRLSGVDFFWTTPSLIFIATEAKFHAKNSVHSTWLCHNHARFKFQVR